MLKVGVISTTLLIDIFYIGFWVIQGVTVKIMGQKLGRLRYAKRVFHPPVNMNLKFNAVKYIFVSLSFILENLLQDHLTCIVLQ